MKTPFPPARTLAVALVAFLASYSARLPVFAQGCVPARFINLSLGPDGITQLTGGEWMLSTSFRYLYADDGWMGTHSWPEYATVVGNQITIYSFDVQATYAFTPRFSTTLTVPWIDGQTSNPREHAGVRHTAHASGLGDLRLVGTAWLFDPATSTKGNLSVGLGVKFPTGDDGATDTYYRAGGPQQLPVDISIQPGDGGWGVMLETAGYRQLAEHWHLYGTAFYLVNPSEQNDTLTNLPVSGAIRPLSVPDQYQLRLGFSWTASPAHALTLSLGGRIDGIPAHDLVGGDEGFRRPGYVIYAEPGVTWSPGRHSLGVFVPLRLDANRTRNVYEESANMDGGGAFAESLLIVTYSFRF